jgi:ferric-dicitrate binding protein FerR (iron transport regulator)
MFRLLAVAVIALALPFAASASAVIDAIQGTVQLGGTPVFKGQRLFPDKGTLSTAQGAQVALRFDDGLRLVLEENSELRLIDTRGGGDGRVVMDLVRGGARVVTGSSVPQDAPVLRFPQATVSVRAPSDFTVVLVNPAYVSVAQGAVAVSNTAGTTVLAAGTTAVVPNSAALASVIPASSVPPVASATAGKLNLASVGAPGGAAGGAQAGTAGTAGGVGAGTAIAIGAAAAAAAIAAGGGGGGGGTTTTTHH